MQHKPMHASSERLLAYAVEASRADPQPVFQFSDLARELNASRPTVSRWKRRGVSKHGAAAARIRFGCSPAWVLLGIGSPDLANASKGLSPADGTRRSTEPDPSAMLGGMAAFLDRLEDRTARQQAGEVIKRFLDASDSLLEATLELELIVGGSGRELDLPDSLPSGPSRLARPGHSGPAARWQ